MDEEERLALVGTTSVQSVDAGVADVTDVANTVASQSFEQTDGENVLQLNLTGDTLQKFIKILQERSLQTAEEAIQYFYSLHNSSQHETHTVGSQSKRRVGRPKSSKSVEVLNKSADASDVDGSVWKITESSSQTVMVQQPGSVVVDGVRKSTRARKNPFAATEFVPVPKIDGQDTDLSEENEEWESNGNSRGEFSMDGEDRDFKPAADDDDSEIDIENNQPVSPSANHLVVECVAEGQPGKTLHVLVTTEPYLSSNKTNKRKHKTKRTSSNFRKAGRPRKRAKDAVLTPQEEETHKCNKCYAYFDNLSELRSHKMSVHGRPNHPYFCEHCDYTAMFDCDMKRHQLVHSSVKKYTCEVCGFATNWERNITLHMENVHGDKKEPWKCDRCDMKIYNHGKVKQHQLSHNPAAQKCAECDLLFENKAKLEWHIANMHVKDKNLQCTQCSYTGSSQINLKLHLKNKHGIEERQRAKQLRRKKKIHCEICNKRLINEDQKEVHMQIHEEGNRDMEKPYYCHVCDARCSDLNQMVRHRGIHTEDKPFACKHCNYRTRWKKDLKTHEMIHTGVKTIHCPQCNYSCYTRQRLRAHLSKHDENRKFLCELCNMTFKSKQALRMHTMYHTGDATYSCDMCEFRTVTEMRLRKHKLRHTDERNYSCNLCGKRFKQPHHVTQHRDIVHLGKPSYRERKRIALQQSAAEALGSLNSTEVNYGQTLVMNDDGTTTLVDLQAVGQSERPEEPTQYVMVETPTGYQYVAVVIPEADGHNAANSISFVGDATHVSADPSALVDPQTAEAGITLGMFYTPGPVGADGSQAVDSLVSLQPQ